MKKIAHAYTTANAVGVKCGGIVVVGTEPTNGVLCEVVSKGFGFCGYGTLPITSESFCNYEPRTVQVTYDVSRVPSPTATQQAGSNLLLSHVPPAAQQ